MFNATLGSCAKPCHYLTSTSGESSMLSTCSWIHQYPYPPPPNPLTPPNIYKDISNYYTRKLCEVNGLNYLPSHPPIAALLSIMTPRSLIAILTCKYLMVTCKLKSIQVGVRGGWIQLLHMFISELNAVPVTYIKQRMGRRRGQRCEFAREF